MQGWSIKLDWPCAIPTGTDAGEHLEGWHVQLPAGRSPARSSVACSQQRTLYKSKQKLRSTRSSCTEPPDV
eukprot:6618710-Pyramimonas_sp.AAC.1